MHIPVGKTLLTGVLVEGVWVVLGSTGVSPLSPAVIRFVENVASFSYVVRVSIHPQLKLTSDHGLYSCCCERLLPPSEWLTCA